MEVVVCDDHRLFGEALVAVLEQRGHVVVAYVTSPDEALSVVSERPVDVVVMDLRFADESGFPALAVMKETSRATEVVVLTAYADDAMRQDVLRVGARACIDKLVSLNEVVDVIERPSMVGYVGLREPARPGGGWPADSPAKFLTSREWEVLKALAQGESTAAMARRLGVGHATARTHVQNLLSKFGVHSRLEAVLFALEHDLLDAEDFGDDEQVTA